MERMNAENSLVFMVEIWKKSLDKSKQCGILLTDLSKAFDYLFHDLLIAKLHAYGFDYLSLKLIHSYLTGRKQRVPVNASVSEWENIDDGVPQISVLGSELYNSNSNDHSCLFYLRLLTRLMPILLFVQPRLSQVSSTTLKQMLKPRFLDSIQWSKSKSR